MMEIRYKSSDHPHKRIFEFDRFCLAGEIVHSYRQVFNIQYLDFTFYFIFLSMNIAFESPDQYDVIALIAELDAYLNTLYPPESIHILDLAALKQPEVLFAVARDSAGEAIGCGAIVLSSEFGELKRVYVNPRGRGQGVAKGLLVLLESRAIEVGCTLLKLETGPHQHEALALYESVGYERRGPFGEYASDPLSVFMEKRIAT
ncbi:GNAT family N-acetyltransferase [Burkholderia sp. AU30280]|uniref:GNAT family N-acetyltransferase n=1 Tax=Burkholderia sp. AU30280 TaxID=2879628 RepID=UPI00299CF410|nr:GNAT family N-acetyltransferase [Burkholderia sp. AU30280]